MNTTTTVQVVTIINAKGRDVRHAAGCRHMWTTWPSAPTAWPSPSRGCGPLNPPRGPGVDNPGPLGSILVATTTTKERTMAHPAPTTDAIDHDTQRQVAWYSVLPRNAKGHL